MASTTSAAARSNMGKVAAFSSSGVDLELRKLTEELVALQKHSRRADGLLVWLTVSLAIMTAAVLGLTAVLVAR